MDEGASDSAVRAAFDRVSRGFHAVRDEVVHSDSLQARRDFGPMTDSYRAVEPELDVHPYGEEHPPAAASLMRTSALVSFVARYR